MAGAKRPIIYSGGGVINSGPEASHLLRELVELTGFPITSTLMGLGAYPASGKNWMGMLGMHGTYEANMAMHDCDVMVCIGARFDDRITGRLNAFSPQLEEDPHRHRSLVDQQERSRRYRRSSAMSAACWKIWCACGGRRREADKKALYPWWEQIARWRARNSFAYTPNDDVIMPQYAVQRLYDVTKNLDTYITTEVGQHQMWAAQHLQFRAAEPLDDVGRARHDGLRPAGRAGRADRASRLRWSSTLPAMPRCR